jgi:predicted chitinase
MSVAQRSMSDAQIVTSVAQRMKFVAQGETESAGH